MSGAFHAAAFDEYAFDVDYSSSSALFLSVDGIQRATGRADDTAKSIYASLTVVDVLNETPNTCTFRTKGFAPQVGQRVIVSLGGVTNPERLFAGTILSVQQSYTGTPSNANYDVQCADDNWKIGQVKVTKRYTGESATDIGIDLVDIINDATGASFSDAGIEAGLPTIDEITFTNEDAGTCFRRLAQRVGGYTDVDEFETILLFLTNTATDPDDLTSSNPPLSISVDRDLSQMITRVLGEGDGATVLSDVSVGDTLLPVDSVEKFNPLGGQFVSGPQRCDYTGIAEGVMGGVVGTGALPSTAPTVTPGAGAGVTTGAHDVTVVFVTGAGRSLPSPVASVTVGNVAAPTYTPVAGTPTSGGSVTAGAHYYAYTEVTPAGETTPSPISNTVTTLAQESAPGATPTVVPGETITSTQGRLDYSANYGYKYTFWDGGVRETTPSGGGTVTTMASDGGTGAWAAIEVASLSTPPAGFQRRWYRTEGGGSTYKLLPSGQAAGQFVAQVSGYYIDIKGDSDLGATAPSSNTTSRQTVPLSGIGLPSSSWVTDRKVYGTAAAGSQLKLVAAIGLTATTYDVTIADGSLGANAPSSAPTANQIAASAIPIGQAAVTARELYMSPAGGGARKRALTIADNATQTGTITMSDATLAGQLAEPAVDTSGLSQPEGQVLPGATSIPMSGAAVIPSAGWAIIGNGRQTVRYTGNSGTALTGVPASGPGSITAAITYNSSITAAPMLTGIPSSSTGSILYAITKGDPANLFIVEDDPEAQAILAAAIGSGDGIVEEFIQDRRLTETELRARAVAVLAERAQIEARIAYAIGSKTDPGCRDHRSGRTIAIDLTEMNVDDAFKIQRVRITNFQPALEPVFNVEASTHRFSFEDLLRQARRQTP